MHSAALGLSLALLPTVFAATYVVSVGADGKFAYDPQYITAHSGDIVNFIFNPKNHTVTQSAFDTPCVPLPGGFDSGFMPVAPDTEQLPNLQVYITDNYPIWVHCKQVGHCGQGMVFAINAPADPDPRSFSAFQARAIAMNGTGSATSTASDTYVTPPPPHWETATATITQGKSTWTTIYSSYDGTPPPSPAPVPVDHKIIVGPDGQLAYSPANISASVGDTVTFEFRPKNHTVTQSSFLNPCQPLAETSTTGAVGFKSGFRPVAADATEFPQFRIAINDTAPIWGYCGQANHCASGMVFSINAAETGPNSFAAFVDLAKRSAGNVTSSGNTSTGGAAASPSSSNFANGASVNSGIRLGLMGLVVLSLMDILS